jgi:hypothetical protein
MIGAASPIVAYVGSSPINAVAPDMVASTMISTGLRPMRSPSRPK